MRKLIMSVVAVMALAVPSIASADVPRCEAIVTANTTITTATLTWTEPAEVDHQFGIIWTHNYNVAVAADGSFIGTGVQLDPSSNQAYTESISGSFGGVAVTNTVGSVSTGTASTVNFTTLRSDNLVHAVSGPTNGSLIIGTATLGSTVNNIDVHVSAPVITSTVTTTAGTESVKNHGQYVKAMGGGKVPAQDCAGMPLVSTQGKS